MGRRQKSNNTLGSVDGGIKTPFIIASQETPCYLMLADITGFTLISDAYSNRDVTNFLCRFHTEMENIVYERPGAEMKHESGDSFWVFTRSEEEIEELGKALVAGYKDFVSLFDSLPDIGRTHLRYAYQPARVIAYEVGGDRQYNSKAHVDLRRMLEAPHEGLRPITGDLPAKDNEL